MILTFATIVVLITVYCFIRDAGSQQVINSRFKSFYFPFQAETVVQHEYVSKPDTVWKMLIRFEDYCLWFPGINRVLPVVDQQRYVHQFSFDMFSFEPGAFFKIRPKSFLPWYKGRIIDMEPNKRLDLEMRFNPVSLERVTFEINQTPRGTSEVICQRSSRGLFSFLTTWGFADKGSLILHNLSFLLQDNQEEIENNYGGEPDQKSAPQLNKETIIAQAVQKGLDGNMDLINAIQDKPTRGTAKAALVKAKRLGKMPDRLTAALNASPNSSEAELTSNSGTETEEEMVNRLVVAGLEGNMDEINALENKAVRGKIKAAIVREKRKKA
ncbi:MAG: hypothetical protein ACE5D0_05315 [Fidelibacterota bacterium]